MTDRPQTAASLRRAGFVAAEDEADALIAAARSPEELASMVARRLRGEPAAWITGHVDFLGVTLHVDPGVYVPRWQTEAVARHALTHLPDGGLAVDLCTGSGAVGAFLAHERPAARVIGTDIDTSAARCAERNGIETYAGSLFDPLPGALRKRVDLIVAVTPYVPDGMLQFLPRDVLAHEALTALSGGSDGLFLVRSILRSCSSWLRDGGSLVLEAGVDQVEQVADRFVAAGLVFHDFIYDGDGDACGVCGSAGTAGADGERPCGTGSQVRHATGGPAQPGAAAWHRPAACPPGGGGRPGSAGAPFPAGVWAAAIVRSMRSPSRSRPSSRVAVKLPCGTGKPNAHVPTVPVAVGRVDADVDGDVGVGEG